MLPRYHILLGLIFAGVLYLLSPGIGLFNLSLIFLSSFLIDFDHYITGWQRTGSLSLKKIFEYHRKNNIKEKKEIARGIRKKSDFHLFHTIEFHALIGLLGIFWIGFFYIFVGMIFHSLTDLLSLTYKGRLHRREFFFFNWISKRI
ncbi:hypothetical protein CMI45_01365 [Candidatus Pacearchaeota archaeon]|nr:hypothetical protein [Candidatus Pacearchaeota archaeon]|tara:strand:+ start:217 stop:654 length:438 start_codon:yes stop_codon:yes gene_type:complete